MSIFIIEGVTGAGNSSSIKALQAITTFVLVDEETTFDGFMGEFAADPEAASRGARSAGGDSR